ncbi:10281_t:CDS:2 [Funneliformis caledonium]|uniref:10281_t:CDS:1 n=1 Tax=Funneliformis caledonium TaxID=1117310 RepID=A0A9N9DSM4_9GLOM|nr:10281_t:CDS:2 [Funneliformis caledonium]
MNVFGKTFIGAYLGHKATSTEVLEWKTSKNKILSNNESDEENEMSNEAVND